MSINNDEPRYITRLMKMECDMGTVKNYINVDKGEQAVKETGL